MLLLGHGSKAIGANDGMYQIAATLKTTGQFYLVECAFLEVNKPDIATGLTNCQEAGAKRIVIIPYFLHFGSHVQRDLPNIISGWQEHNPAIEIIMGQHLGFSPLLVSLVQERINEALGQK